MLGLAIDIMAKTRPTDPSPWDQIEAIVLLDEIGAHLHPRWKMRVVASLRLAFKRMQFLATTHDPLCLRGLHDGEVAVLRRPVSGSPYLVPDLPNIEGMRVDQLLMSEYFGLSSTLDPEIEAEFDEYYWLLSHADLRPEQRDRVAVLREKLTALEFAGTTRRERLMLEVIDGFIARERNAKSSAEARRTQSQTRRRLARLQDTRDEPQS